MSCFNFFPNYDILSANPLTALSRKMTAHFHLNPLIYSSHYCRPYLATGPNTISFVTH